MEYRLPIYNVDQLFGLSFLIQSYTYSFQSRKILREQ